MRLGVSQTTVFEWLYGKTTPEDQLEKIINLLKELRRMTRLANKDERTEQFFKSVPCHTVVWDGMVF
jgi:hypothetical protein